MYTLLVRLMLVTALLQLGWSIVDFQNCHTRACLQKVEQQSRNILNIKWKPISVFPEEAKKFGGR